MRAVAIVGAWALAVGGCVRPAPSPRPPVVADTLAPASDAPASAAPAPVEAEDAPATERAPAVDAAAEVAAPEPPASEVAKQGAAKPEPVTLIRGANHLARARRDRDNDVCVRPKWPKEGVIGRPPVYRIEHRELDSGDLDHDRLLLDLLKFEKELRRCYQQGVGQRLPPGDQSIRGRAAITLRIDGAGRVVDTKVRFSDRCVRVCIERSALDWQVARLDEVEAPTAEITWRIALSVAPDTSPRYF